MSKPKQFLGLLAVAALMNVGTIAICIGMNPAFAGDRDAVINAREFRLIDSEGRCRGRLFSHPANQQPCLALLDTRGRPLIKIQATDWGVAGLFLQGGTREHPGELSLLVGATGEPNILLTQESTTGEKLIHIGITAPPQSDATEPVIRLDSSGSTHDSCKLTLQPVPAAPFRLFVNGLLTPSCPHK